MRRLYGIGASHYNRAMSDEAVASRLRALLSYHTGLPESEIAADARPDNTRGWDSVANLALMAAVEEEYGVTIGTRDAMKLRTLADVVRFVEEKRQPQ